jgi:hypothetical protein
MSDRIMDKKLLTVICVAYKRYQAIHTLINSFLCQTHDSWKLIVIHDGPDDLMNTIMKPYTAAYPHIQYVETKERHNDYGHSLRQIGIGMANTPSLLLTNDDNLGLCNMIHSHNNPGYHIQEDYCLFNTYPKKLCIDMGCFIVRTEMAKEVGFKDKSFAGDGTFVDDIIKKFKPRVFKSNRVLFVHN